MNTLAASTVSRLDLCSNDDTVQSAWIHVKTVDTIIGGVYRRFRNSIEEEINELLQLKNQILLASQTGKNVLVLGDTNMDHNNPSHKMYKEATDFLSVL